MNVKNNRRSRDTEARVEEVFLNLLSQKHISNITVYIHKTKSYYVSRTRTTMMKSVYC